MKKIALLGIATAALLLVSGCAKKNPVDTTPSPVVEDTTAPVTDTTAPAPVVEAKTGMSMEELQGSIKTVYFAFDKYSIKDDMVSVVETNADLLKKEEANGVALTVEGNCDEWGSDEYNYALGLKRAKAVKDSLISLGVSGDKIKTLSNGEGNPVCSEKNESCWSQNRRAEIKLSN